MTWQSLFATVRLRPVPPYLPPEAFLVRAKVYMTLGSRSGSMPAPVSSTDTVK